jgi:hypothetical protein
MYNKITKFRKSCATTQGFSSRHLNFITKQHPDQPLEVLSLLVLTVILNSGKKNISNPSREGDNYSHTKDSQLATTQQTEN